MLLNFDQSQYNLTLLVFFLLLSVTIGFLAGKHVTTLRDYALAKRTLSSGILSMSLFATLVSIEDVAIELAYRTGVNSFLYPLLFAIVAFLLGWFVFPAFTSFRKCLTVADVMTPSPLSIEPGATLREAIDKMENRQSQISVLPVTDDKQCIGLIRIHDIYHG